MTNQKEITYEGRTYMVTASLDGVPVQVTPELESAAYKKLTGASVTCGSGRVIKLGPPGSCPANIVQNTSHPITITASGGQADYTYRIYVGGTLVHTSTLTPLTSYTYNHIFTATGSQVVKGEVTDSCSTGAQTDFSECTVNVSAPACDFTASLTCPACAPCAPSASVSFTSIATAGIGPTYNHVLLRDGVQVASALNQAASYTFNVTLPASAGTYSYTTQITDNGCIPATTRTAVACNVVVQIPCTPVVTAITIT